MRSRESSAPVANRARGSRALRRPTGDARQGALLVAAVAALLSAGRASAQDVLARVSLPLDGRAVDLAPLLPAGEGPVRLALSGTLSSSADGSVIDAVSRFADGRRIDAEGPFVRLPPGSRRLRDDPAVHRYVVEIPGRGDTRVALDVAPVALRNLIPASELRAGLTGAIEVEVLAPPPSALRATLSRTRARAARLPWAAFAGGAAGLPLIALLAWLLVWRGRQRADERLVRRARAGLRAVQRESASAGPAFDEVAAQGRHMLDGALEMQRHYRKACAAERRTRGLHSGGARAGRGELREGQRRALSRLREICERLEETAARLAAHGAAGHRLPDVDALLRGLDAELVVAVSADDEAHDAT